MISFNVCGIVHQEDVFFTTPSHFLKLGNFIPVSDAATNIPGNKVLSLFDVTWRNEFLTVDFLKPGS